MEDNKMKFRTVCALVQPLYSEKECPKTKNSLALSKNGGHDQPWPMPQVPEKS